MTIHILVIYGNEVCTQVVKSVIDKLKYQLVLPPVMLMVAMAVEGEPREIECKLDLIKDAVIWNACPKVHFQQWTQTASLHEENLRSVLFLTFVFVV